MAAELPMHLKQLEPLTGALDMLRYLADGAADAESIQGDLELSDRSFDKAKRRLVTNDYINVRSDGIIELTQKGIQSAQELADYDANAPTTSGAQGKVQRRVLVALPRSLVAGQPTEVTIGFEADQSGQFPAAADVVLRCSALYAKLSTSSDENVRLGRDSLKHSLLLTPEQYDQIRFKLQVFQLSQDGEDISKCGGLYVDVNVQAGGQVGALVAYSANLEFSTT